MLWISCMSLARSMNVYLCPPGDTDGDPVSVLDQLVVPDGFGERPPDGFAEFFDKGPFNFFCTLSHRSF